MAVFYYRVTAIALCLRIKIVKCQDITNTKLKEEEPVCCRAHQKSCMQSRGLRTPRGEITFTARPKIQSQSQSFMFGRSIFCLPHRPNLLDIFDLCLHWVSVVRASSATDCNKNKNLNFIGFSQEHLTNYARPFFLNLERGKRSMQQKVPASLVRRRVVWPQNKAEVSSVSTCRR